MRIKATLAFSTGLTITMLAIGCGNTVKSVCDDLDDQCSDFPLDACLEDGKARQAAAEDLGCEDEFDAYLDCVSNARCTWRTSCQSQRDTLVKCGVSFPP